jgi:outer membrane cobalamin receptor
MRMLILVLVLLPPGVASADADDKHTPEPAHTAAPEETVVVTATREPRGELSAPASVTRIDGEDLAELSAKHQAEVLNEVAGVYVQRGSGAESLAGIRSPVLTGAGGCGAFLIAEDSLPIRPVGFCNLNEMFELNYEQAHQIEVLRGPGSSMFGASAVHGVVNLLTPDVEDLAAYSAGPKGLGFLCAPAVGFREATRWLGCRCIWRRHQRSGLARLFRRR